MLDRLTGLEIRALHWLAEEAVRTRAASGQPIQLKFKGVWYEVAPSREPGAPVEVRPIGERVIR